MKEQAGGNLRIQLAQKERELYSIQKIGQALSNTLKLDDLLNLIMKEITEIMEAERSTLYIVDHQRNEIWSKIALKAEVREIRQKFGKGISGWVAETGGKLNIPDAYQDSRFDPSTDKRTGYRTRSILCIPVWEPLSSGAQRKMVGVIQVLNKKAGFFTDGDEGILEAIASQVAIAISNAHLYQQLEKKFREIDLLYEFEQQLSSEYDVREVFRQILDRTVRHQAGEFAAVAYPLNNQVNLISVSGSGQTDFRSIPATVYKEIYALSGGNMAAGELPPGEMKKLLPEVSEVQSLYAKIIPAEPAEEKRMPAIFVFQARSPELRETPDGDFQFLGMVEQKISRALELNALREALLKQERLSAVGQMMSTVVHDLRSPVNSIYGFMELLLEGDNTKEEREEYAQIIRMEIQSITNMTSEILDFAKGKTSIIPRKTAVKDILKRFIPETEQLFRQSKISFRSQGESQKLVYADVDKFTRVLYNIAKNAKEAMSNEGEFYFKIYDDNGKVVFELSDTGPGIPEEIRDRLFESFVTSGKKSGTGLGLAIVKKIVDDHRGEIEVKSEPGKGTIFYIKLPEYVQEHV